MSGGRYVQPVQIDVSRLVQRSVASLYAHLVTRPTGRAVRLAIESQLAEAGERSCSLIDLSEVTVLDFSCADEVVAKLLLRYLEADRPREAYFVFRGVRDLHREPIEAVLERQRLAAVGQREDGLFELMGSRGEEEHAVWRILEGRGRLEVEDVADALPSGEQRSALERLVRRRLVFREPSGRCHALSRLVQDLPPR
ncbi:MAG: hypothetical protein KY453_11875 [Gemmatimonadetes bacterium]|nr:hypothetical protein [Gemmatimonadota bacterium]